ncbi:hypothetical protein HY950_01395 [Candidatus Gottesmanbacteria bacterium]|nr:hypothetical protein [Candidatus Gottesmanbacteria bacterium]
MNYQHQALAGGGWEKLSFIEQMAHIGSEVERAMKWRNKGNAVYSRMAIERALELIDFILRTRQPLSKLREMARVRECLVDDFYADNTHQSTDELWRKYFYAFALACARKKNNV